MPSQLYDWTCSACALEWVIRATGLDYVGWDIYTAREQTVSKIGYPQNINPTYGLMDASGIALRDVLASYGQDSSQGWLDFDDVYNLAQGTTGMMSGQAWYHWVALRGVQGSCLYIANSAPGYKGVYSTLSRDQYNALGGFSVVYLE